MAKMTMKKAIAKAKPAAVLQGITGSYKPSPAQKAEERKWRAQDDLRTMQRAAEVKADPSRVKAAQAEAQAQMKALATVTKK